MIININENIPLFTRYNGGWIKTVNGIDKDYKNGYSLVGEFLPVSRGNIDLDENLLYLDCSIGGSRKNQEKNYTLFKIIDNEIFIIKEIEDGGSDWATSLWESIESELQIKENMADKTLKMVRKLDDHEFFELMETLRKTDKRYQTFTALMLGHYTAYVEVESLHGLSLGDKLTNIRKLDNDKLKSLNAYFETEENLSNEDNEIYGLVTEVISERIEAENWD